MIVISEAQREILKAIFDSEVEVNEISQNIKKIDERAASEMRVASLSLPLKDPAKTLENYLDFTKETIGRFESEAVQIKKDRLDPSPSSRSKPSISELTRRLKVLSAIQRTILEMQYQREKYVTDLKKIEKGMTSGMIEDYGINRKTFTDNIDSLVEENLIEESLTEKHGKQNWKYYKTTMLGKVLIFKPMKVVREEKGVKIVDFPPESYTADPDVGIWGGTHIAFFYDYLERLKKFDLYEAQIQERQKADDLKYRGDVLHEQLNFAMVAAFDSIDITKLEGRELSTFWGHEGHYQDPEYGVSIMVPILPEAGFTPMSTIEPMTEMEMRYQREKREKKFPEPGPLGEKGWFVNISAYFRLNEWNPKTGEYEEEMVIKTRRKMFDFIEDVLAFNFLVNLKIITGNLKAASPATKKLFKDPDLNKFYNNMLNELVERSGSLNSYLKKYKI